MTTTSVTSNIHQNPTAALGTTARYVVLSAYKSNRNMYICEVEVYGEVGASPVAVACRFPHFLCPYAFITAPALGLP